MKREPLSRTEAKKAGLLRYYTGRPCKRGHFSERWVSTCMCMECLNVHNRKWKKEHVKQCTAEKREWTRRNAEKVRRLKRGYYANNEAERAAQAARSKRWRLLNREKTNAATRRWQSKNLARARATTSARQARRRATMRRAIPPWADLAEIQKFYDRARELTDQTGIPHEVDHIVPLMGNLVSGLHIPINLQVIPESENRSKGRRFDWETYQRSMKTMTDLAKGKDG